MSQPATPVIRALVLAPAFTLLFVYLSGIIFMHMYAYYVQDQDLVKNGTKTVATITRNIIHPTPCSRSGCHDWIVYYGFQTATGQYFESSEELFSQRPLGSHADIYYLNANPQDTKLVDEITGPGELLVGPILILVPAAFFAWLGFLSFRTWRRTMKPGMS